MTPYYYKVQLSNYGSEIALIDNINSWNSLKH